MPPTTEQMHAADNGQVVRITANGRVYVRMREDVYALQQNSDDDISGETVAALIRRTMSDDDEGEPLLENYQK